MADTPQPDHDRLLAGVVLPTAADLWGDGWLLDGDGADPSAGAEGGGVDCLPPDVPDEVTSAEVSFVRAGGVVHAISSVYAGIGDARRAWAAIADERFARCFAEGVAVDVQLPGELTLLGPVLPTAEFAVDRHGRRLVTHRAAFSQADADRVLPIVLDIAGVLAGRILVVVWAADEARHEAERGWPRLVERLQQRGDVAVARGAG